MSIQVARTVYAMVLVIIQLFVALFPMESQAYNTAPPAQPVRLIFIHHSTGQNWLDDGNGQLAIALRDNNYFVSDTNYGWGPDAIGNSTDIGNWWTWFRGSSSTTYLSALYAESGRTFSFSRLSTTPSGANEIVMFKSCFPNSALQGNVSDPIPAIGNNPLRGEDSGSQYHTISNAKGIYNDLLNYFQTRQDKLFIVITAPPLTDATYSANARAFNQWLMNDWLSGYPYRNVAVFDFYNVLTTNGGNSGTNDLNLATGNHHRWWQGAIQHKTDGDNDANPNVLEYPSGDDHPSQAGNLKATAEFIPLLNVFYNSWKSGDVTPPDLTLNVVTTPVAVTSQTIGGTVETGATVSVATDTAASDGPATVTGSTWSYTITGLAAGANGITVTALDAAGNSTVRTTSIVRNPTMSVAFAGSGGGTVASTPAGLTCNTACTGAFTYNSGVTLQANQDEYSLVPHWSDGCGTGTVCSQTMDGDKSATVTFDRNTANMARIEGTSPTYWSSLQSAYDNAGSVGVIHAWGVRFQEDVTANGSKQITIAGGYNGAYGSVTGTTTLNGKLTISNGCLTVGNIVIAPAGT